MKVVFTAYENQAAADATREPFTQSLEFRIKSVATSQNGQQVPHEKQLLVTILPLPDPYWESELSSV